MSDRTDTKDTKQMISTVLMAISPHIASDMLAKNTANRPLNSRRASKLAEAIKRGEWEINGDTIRISKRGVLLDGQHRLTAIKESGVTVQTLVVFNLDDDVFHTIDTGGTARTTSDILAISGEKHYTLLASSARISYLRFITGNPFSSVLSIQPTVSQIEEFILKNPLLKDSVSHISASKWIKKNIEPSTAAMCHFVFTAKNKDDSIQFFDAIESGIGLHSGSPILLLRDRLMESKGSTGSLKKSYKAALMFKAFKQFCKNEKIKTLRVRLDGDSPEKDLYSL